LIWIEQAVDFLLPQLIFVLAFIVDADVHRTGAWELIVAFYVAFFPLPPVLLTFGE